MNRQNQLHLTHPYVKKRVKKYIKSKSKKMEKADSFVYKNLPLLILQYSY